MALFEGWQRQSFDIAAFTVFPIYQIRNLFVKSSFQPTSFQQLNPYRTDEQMVASNTQKADAEAAMRAEANAAFGGGKVEWKL